MRNFETVQYVVPCSVTFGCSAVCATRVLRQVSERSVLRCHRYFGDVPLQEGSQIPRRHDGNDPPLPGERQVGGDGRLQRCLRPCVTIFHFKNNVNLLTSTPVGLNKVAAATSIWSYCNVHVDGRATTGRVYDYCLGI